MTRRQLNPGDVAIVTGQLEQQSLAMWSGYGWHCATAVGPIVSERPLVVIDPEDREQIGRLADHLGATEQNSYYATLAHFANALREFANPTPPEPEGIGAVVESEDGRKWVRTLPDGGPAKWLLATFEPVERGYVWSAIPAVRVLSEGVTA